MTPTAPATGNRLLAALAPGELDRIAPHLERIELRRGAILHEPPGQLAEVWFPEANPDASAAVEQALRQREGS